MTANPWGDLMAYRLVCTARGKVWHISFEPGVPFSALCGIRTDFPGDNVTFERMCRRCQRSYDLECEQRRKAGVL